MKRTKNIKQLLPEARSNKTAMLTHTTTVSVLVIFTLLQAADNKTSWGYFGITALIGYIPILINYILWKKNSCAKALRYSIAIGFWVFYTFSLITTTNQFVFVFIIPLIIALSVYNDVKLSTLSSIVIFIENTAAVALGSKGIIQGYMGLDYGIIQIVLLILTGTFANLTNQTLQNNFDAIYKNLNGITNEMKLGINDIHIGLEKLTAASAATINAMQEVATGTSDTADAVQNQLLQSHEIQSKVDLVSASTIDITNYMTQTLQALSEGNENVSLLVEKVDATVASGKQVTERLQILEQSVIEMHSIVDFINNIAREIGLLSLNARVEASHAGEHGRGFAVVASEIANMAEQTKSATTNISELIEHTSSGIADVVAEIHQMVNDIREEKQSTDKTADSFTSIQMNTHAVHDNIDILTAHIHDLTEANNLIAESVQTISAVSEEVSAHATETTVAENQNAQLLLQIEQRMQALLDTIHTS